MANTITNNLQFFVQGDGVKQFSSCSIGVTCGFLKMGRAECSILLAF